MELPHKNPVKRMESEEDILPSRLLPPLDEDRAEAVGLKKIYPCGGGFEEVFKFLGRNSLKKQIFWPELARKSNYGIKAFLRFHFLFCLLGLFIRRGETFLLVLRRF